MSVQRLKCDKCGVSLHPKGDRYHFKYFKREIWNRSMYNNRPYYFSDGTKYTGVVYNDSPDGRLNTAPKAIQDILDCEEAFRRYVSVEYVLCDNCKGAMKLAVDERISDFEYDYINGNLDETTKD